MAGASAYIGTTTTLALGTSTYDLDITSMAWNAVTRVGTESTPMNVILAPATFGNSSHLSGSGHVDPGQLVVEGFFDPALTPPLIPGSSLAETIVVTFPLLTGDTSAAIWASNGFGIDFSCNAPFEEMMTCTVTFKLTADVDITAAAAA